MCNITCVIWPDKGYFSSECWFILSGLFLLIVIDFIVLIFVYVFF